MRISYPQQVLQCVALVVLALAFAATHVHAVGISPPIINVSTSTDMQKVVAYVYNTKPHTATIALTADAHIPIEIRPSRITLNPEERQPITMLVDTNKEGAIKVYATELPAQPGSNLQEAVVLKIHILKSEHVEQMNEESNSAQTEDQGIGDSPRTPHKTTTIVLASAVLILGAIAYGASFM